MVCVCVCVFLEVFALEWQRQRQIGTCLSADKSLLHEKQNKQQQQNIEYKIWFDSFRNVWKIVFVFLDAEAS